MDHLTDMQLIAIGLGLGAVLWLLLPLIKKLSDKQNYPYVARGFLFTKAENSFRGILEKVVGGRALVYGKVRIADVVTIRKGLTGAKRMSALGKIAQKHFDYVLCDAASSKILCVLELDDSSHAAKDRKARDAFVKEVCRVANVPLINVPTKGGYNFAVVDKLIAPYLGAVDRVSLNNTPKEYIERDAQRTQEPDDCPKEGCAGKLISQKDSSGHTLTVCTGCRYSSTAPA